MNMKMSYHSAPDKADNAPRLADADNGNDTDKGPFDSDANFPLITPRLEKLLRLLGHIAGFGHRLIALTGPKGVGKTTLLEELLKARRAPGSICYMVALKQDTPDQLIREVCDEFGIKAAGEAGVEELLPQLDRFLVGAGSSEQNMIVLDDAHLLNNKVLALLAELSLNYRESLQIILCGEPALFNKLRALPVIRNHHQLLYHRQLRGFDLNECKQYLHMRFTAAHPLGEDAFTEADCLWVSRESGGQPAQIDRLMRDRMERGVGQDRKFDTKFKWLLGAGAYALIGVVAALFLPVTEDGADLRQTAAPEPERKPVAIRPIERNHAGLGGIAAMETVEQVEAQPLLSGPGVMESASDPETETELFQVDDASEGLPDAQEVGSPESRRLLESVDEATVEELPPEADSMPEQELSVAGVVPETEEPVADDEIDDKARDIEITQSVGEAKPEPENVGNFTAQEREILSLDPEAYTIQLLGSYREAKIHKVLATVPADSEYRYFRTLHNGSPWYVLIYGSYLQYSKAVAAAAELPRQLNPEAAWVRGIGGIQKDLANRDQP